MQVRRSCFLGVLAKYFLPYFWGSLLLGTFPSSAPQDLSIPHPRLSVLHIQSPHSSSTPYPPTLTRCTSEPSRSPALADGSRCRLPVSSRPFSCSPCVWFLGDLNL